MQLKTILSALLSLSTVAFTVLTIICLDSKLDYFFVFPVLAILSFVLLLGLNISKQSIRVESDSFDSNKKEILSLPLSKRMAMLGVVAFVMLSASAVLITANALANSPIMNIFCVSMMAPWLVCRLVYSLFDSPVKHLAVIGIMFSWCISTLIFFEQLKSVQSSDFIVIALNALGFIVMFEVARNLTLKLTGHKPLG